MNDNNTALPALDATQAAALATVVETYDTTLDGTAVRAAAGEFFRIASECEPSAHVAAALGKHRMDALLAWNGGRGPALTPVPEPTPAPVEVMPWDVAPIEVDAPPATTEEATPVEAITICHRTPAPRVPVTTVQGWAAYRPDPVRGYKSTARKDKAPMRGEVDRIAAVIAGEDRETYHVSDLSKLRMVDARTIDIPGVGPIAIEPHAFKQLCDRQGRAYGKGATSFLDRMPAGTCAETFNLVQSDLLTWGGYYGNEEGVRGLDFGTRMINGQRQIFRIVTPSYLSMPADEVLAVTLDALKAKGHTGIVAAVSYDSATTGLAATISWDGAGEARPTMTTEEMGEAIEGAGLRTGRYGARSVHQDDIRDRGMKIGDVVGDALGGSEGGISLRTDDRGSSSLNVGTFLLRLVCLNGLIAMSDVGDGTKRRHRGPAGRELNTGDRALRILKIVNEALSLTTEQLAEAREQYESLSRPVESIKLDGKTFVSVTEALEHLAVKMGKSIRVSKDAMVEMLLRGYEIRDGEATTLDGSSLLDVFNSVTAAATHAAELSPVQRVQAQEYAGQLAYDWSGQTIRVPAQA